VADQLPSGVTPEDVIHNLLNHTNTTINNSDFTSINQFTPRVNDRDLQVGDIVDIAMWPHGLLDNGSVMLTDLQPSHFRFTTINARRYGMHPVSGQREFGYENTPNGGVRFYTRGADRANDGVLFDGLINWLFDNRQRSRNIQHDDWTAAMKGLADQIAS